MKPIITLEIYIPDAYGLEYWSKHGAAEKLSFQESLK